jgi:SAM-dependent methyltransferase
MIQPQTTTEPLSPTAFDEYAGDYDQALNRGLRYTGEGKEYFAQTRVQWTRRVLGGDFCESWRVLDYGCGTGTATPFLLDGLVASSVLGVDTSAESCAQARQLNPDSRAAFETIDYLAGHPGSMDLAYCNGVFHHIPLDLRVQAAANVYAALKPGGWFAFWENNPWNPVTRLLMSMVPFDRDAIMLWPHRARAMLQGVGFNVMRSDYLFVFPSILRALRPLEPAMCKLPTGGQYLILAQKPKS